MSSQNEALRLADWHKAMADGPKRNEAKRDKHRRTEAELRRLSAENERIGPLAERVLELKAQRDALLAVVNKLEYSSDGHIKPVALEHRHEWFRTGGMEPGQMRCIHCGKWGKETPPCTDCRGLGYDSSGQLCGCQDNPSFG